MRGVKRCHERLPVGEELDKFAEEFRTGCIEYSDISLTTPRHLCKRLAIPCYGARDEVLDRLKVHQRQVTEPVEEPESAADHVDHGPVPRELLPMEIKMPHFAEIFHRHLQSQNVILQRTVPTCLKPPQRGPLQHLNKLELRAANLGFTVAPRCRNTCDVVPGAAREGPQSPDGFAYRAKHRLPCEPVTRPPWPALGVSGRFQPSHSSGTSFLESSGAERGRHPGVFFHLTHGTRGTGQGRRR